MNPVHHTPPGLMLYMHVVLSTLSLAFRSGLKRHASRHWPREHLHGRWTRSLLLFLLLGAGSQPLQARQSYREPGWLSIVPTFLPADAQQRIAAERRWLLAHRGYLENRLAEAQPLIRYIGQAVENRSLPNIIMLLPLIESGYRLDVVSPKGAAGLWQLMPDTARRFHLPMSPDYDARLAASSATEAALSYLQWLNEHFNGDWLLTLAAYNAGEGRIRQAQQQSGELGYWRLPLPDETQHYVPRLLALAELIQQAERYQLHLPEWQQGERLIGRKVTGPLYLTTLAKADHGSVAQLEALNPALRSHFLPAGQEYALLLPQAQALHITAQSGPPPSDTLGLDMAPVPPLVILTALDDPLIIPHVEGLNVNSNPLSLQSVENPLRLGSSPMLVPLSVPHEPANQETRRHK